MYKNVNDYELLYLIAENNESAYNDIYSKYDNMVKYEASKFYKKSKYMGISAEDVYQAGLYGLNLAINNFDEHEGTLFYTCANTFIIREIQTFIRNNSRQKHNLLSDSISLDKEIDEDGDTICSLLDTGINVLKEYDNYSIQKKLVDFKYDLPFVQSLIFELKLNNFSNREIAALLDVQYKTVDNSLLSIRNRLKKELNKIELF